MSLGATLPQDRRRHHSSHGLERPPRRLMLTCVVPNPKDRRPISSWYRTQARMGKGERGTKTLFGPLFSPLSPIFPDKGGGEKKREKMSEHRSLTLTPTHLFLFLFPFCVQHAIRRFGRGGEGDSSAFASFSPVCAIDYEGIGAEEEEAGATPRQMTAIPPTFGGLALKDVRRGKKCRVRKWVGVEDQDSGLCSSF